MKRQSIKKNGSNVKVRRKMLMKAQSVDFITEKLENVLRGEKRDKGSENERQRKDNQGKNASWPVL